MNEPHEQFDDPRDPDRPDSPDSFDDYEEFEAQLRELNPVDLSPAARQAMVEQNDTLDGDESHRMKLVWVCRAGQAVAACALFALLVWIMVPQNGRKPASPRTIGDTIESSLFEDDVWTIRPVGTAECSILLPRNVIIAEGELRIESKSMDKPEQPLRVLTPNGDIELSDAGYYIVSYKSPDPTAETKSETPLSLPPDSTPDWKGESMKSMTRVLILTGVATLTNAFGSINGSGDTLLAAEKDKAPVAHAVKANSDFAFDLYKQLAKENAGENLFFSPYSITSALAMTTEGARGNTAKQMGDVLRFPKVAMQNNQAQPWDTSVIHSGLGALNQRYNAADKSYQLAVANAIWVEQTFPLRGAFTAALSKPYGVKMVNPVDFKGNADGERQRINSWVEDKTKERIKDLLPEDSLNDLTRVVLTNAIYFKGDWAAKFEKRDTANRVFKLADGKQLKTPMMFRDERKFRFAMLKADGTPDTSRFGRSDKNGFAIIELPYKGEELSMIAIAPNSPTGLAGVEASLNQANVDKWISRMHLEEVDVLLPKFKMTIDYKLNGTLKAMGMKDAFTRQVADFTGISDSPEADRLYISLVQHKAFVEVNEEGTEASAATAVVIAIESARVVPAFNADRPFLYLIRDNKTGTILFLGRVMNPKS